MRRLLVAFITLMPSLALATTAVLPGQFEVNSSTDLVVDSITYNTAVSSCTGTGCGLQLQRITGAPDAADSTTWRLYNDDLFPAFVDTGAVSYTAVKGTGSAVYGPGFWAISNGTTLDSGDEIAATAGLTCQDVIEYSTLLVPTDSNCAATHASTVKLWIFLK